jgi:hypothetical protein
MFIHIPLSLLHPAKVLFLSFFRRLPFSKLFDHFSKLKKMNNKSLILFLLCLRMSPKIYSKTTHVHGKKKKRYISERNINNGRLKCISNYWTRKKSSKRVPLLEHFSSRPRRPLLIHQRKNLLHISRKSLRKSPDSTTDE